MQCDKGTRRLLHLFRKVQLKHLNLIPVSSSLLQLFCLRFALSVLKEWEWILLATLLLSIRVSLRYPFSRRMRKSASNSTFSILRKELRDGSLQSLLGGSSYFVPSTDPDPLLSSFMFSPSVVDEPHSVLPTSSVETSPVKESTIEDSTIRYSPRPMVSDKEQEEKSRRCEFVRSLVMSTILDEL
ncbi:Protein DEHYDRATION-INDUCED 19 homolog 7 [Linum perenne]